MAFDFSETERDRYARHFALPGFGEEGQRRLKTGSVLVVGAGGLGSPLLLYLAAAGVGHIGIIDPDRVSRSNLQRQVLYTEADLGRLKVEAARERLLTLNPEVRIDIYPERFTRHNALALVAQYDVLADGADNFPTRYLSNDACVIGGKVNVHAAIFRYEGQVSVFNLPNRDGARGVQYRDLFPTPPAPDAVPDCAEGGVLGVLPGIVGSIQALEVIKVLSGVGEPLAGRLLIMDATTFWVRTIPIRPNPDLKPLSELTDYEVFCGLPPERPVRQMDMETFRTWQAQGLDFQLVDVREPHEYAIANLGGELIPLGTLRDEVRRIDRHRPVVIHCQTGKRSMQAYLILANMGFDNLYAVV